MLKNNLNKYHYLFKLFKLFEYKYVKNNDF